MIKYYQCPLNEEDMDGLLKVTGKTNSKDALQEAVKWTIETKPRPP